MALSEDIQGHARPNRQGQIMVKVAECRTCPKADILS